MPAMELSLLDLADRLLDRGVVLAGRATISIAGVDLVYLGLNAVLSSVETLQRATREHEAGPRAEPLSGANASSAAAVGTAAAEAAVIAETAEAAVERLQGALPERVDVDPEGVEQGLAKLVLTLVEFIRQLLERQAVRRMEGGSLTEEQTERMGLALQRLEAKMGDLCRVFGIDPDELNINLGPLGDLL
jgi:hypothetical protein